MQNRQKWSYNSNVPQSAKNLDEFNQRLAHNNFFAPGFRDQILKPVLHLAFVTSDKERKTTTNLRVTCYLNENNEKSFKIFTSHSTDNINTYEYFKKNLDESWVDITYNKISYDHFFTYVETKELYGKEELEYFFEKINQYYYLPSDLYNEFRVAAGLSSESLFPIPMFSTANKNEFFQKNDADLAKLHHDQKELCNLIFTDSHFDATVWKILKKVSPKLKSLGYNCFFMEAPETTTLDNCIDNHKMYIQRAQPASRKINSLKN